MAIPFSVQTTDHYTRYSPGDAQEARAIVIHVPGFNGDGFSEAPFALRVASMGWDCYVLEPPWSATPDLQSPSPTILFDLFDRLAPALHNLMAQLPEGVWRALTGFSMGGMFVSRALADAPAPDWDAAALILSSGDWSFLPRTAINAMPELRAAIDENALHHIESHMRQVSPISRADHFPPTPLLMLNVEQDPRVPAENARGFYNALADAYHAAGVPEQVEWHLLPGNRHEFRRHMQALVCDWLRACYEEGEGD